ncbi:MAG: 2-oxoacid:acceptor oxidoreductase family protein [Deltaproteobacteria bacterium]|nr:2-oxoacid:acceptor oxidoreductase family protein [Deltaproteobacteria bacterium]MBW1913373.1 2-oxoacid:acceptor oxidoreductase family protein [Deltaproteobacteria bacterium]
MAQTDTESIKKEIILTGFGGQGIVLSGKVTAQAASLGDNKQSTLVQSYGPEARGGACSTSVVISDDPIHYPYVREPDILVCMSQSGFDKYFCRLKEGGTLLIDQDLVSFRDENLNMFAIPSTRMAEELGRKMMANIIMVGFLTAITGVVSVEAARKTVLASVPKGTEEMNMTAFNKGYDYGLAILKARQKKAEGKAGSLK